MLRNWSLNPLAKVAIGILRSYGADAHIYLPGVGTVNGITAGNYLDSAGTTAATVDNPVGLSLDALQAMTLGVEKVTNGTFTTDTSGWTAANAPTISVSAGKVSITNNGATNGLIYQAMPTTVGKTYLISGDVVFGGGFARIEPSDVVPTSVGGSGINVSSSGSYTFNFVASVATTYIVVGNRNDFGATNTFGNISVREIPGVHATQATTANKPILRRGLLNQLLYSYNLANAAWNQGGVGPVTMNGNRATIQTTSTAVRYLTQTVPGYAAASGEKITQAIAIKKTTGTLTRYPVFASEQSIGSKMLGITTIDTTNGIATAWSAYTGFTILPGSVASIADYGDLWLVALSGTTDTSAVVWTEFYPAAASTATQSTGQVTGAIGPDVVVAGMGLFQGTYTAQQIIDAGGIPLTTTAAASNPSAGKYSWQFDGSNDSLSLSAPLFQMSDDHAVIAGFKADAANSYVFSQNNTAATTLVGAIAVTSGGFARALWEDDGATTAFITGSVPITGVTKVVTAIKRTNAKQLRVNGAQDGATNNTAMGATTLNTASIGSFTTAGNFQGSIYPVIAIKGTVSDAELMVLEKYVGMCCGVSI